MINKTKIRKISILILFFSLTNCSSYKTSWDCPKVTGIGCSSVNYADEMAKEQILLNTSPKTVKKVLINQDPLGDDYQEIEISKTE